MASDPPAVTPGEDYPLLCEACLGDNPYVRMTKSVNGAECKISKRPFTSFRWKPGKQGYRQTVVSYTVAAQKNICQSCLTDLAYGLPVQIRDAFLRQALAQGVPGADAIAFDSMPLSRVGQDYQYNLVQANKALGIEDEQTTHGASDALRAMAKGAAQLAASDKTFGRQLPRLCEFWVEGGCSKARENQCPFRPCCGAHVFPELKGQERTRLEEDVDTRGPIAVALSEELRQKLRAAITSQNDDGERKRGGGSRLVEDETTSTLVVTSLPKACTEEELLQTFSAHGEVVRVSLTQGGRAFVEFAKRSEASEAMAAKPLIRGSALVMEWAKKKKAGDAPLSKPSGAPAGDSAGAASAEPAPSQAKQQPSKPALMLPPPGMQPGEALPPPPQALLTALANRTKRLKTL